LPRRPPHAILDGMPARSPIPPGPYRTLVVDPPWPYRSRNCGTLHPGAVDTPAMRPAPMPYATLPLEAIAALPVPRLAHPDGAHLYLWTTQAFLRAAYDVLDAWRFRQGALLVWSKPAKGVVGTWVCSAEFCIFARRGTLAAKRRHVGTVLSWPRSGRHSSKPAAFLDLVESVSPGPYLELFARASRDGWTSWGDEL
jgi:N6-adenosine-specific RNA methylase IME4